MDSVNIKLLEDQSSRRKREITIILSLIICFTLIIGSIISVLTVLKHKAESESLSKANPIKAIKAVCSLTPSPHSCVDQLRDIQSNQTSAHVNPSEIFALSLRASYNQLTILSSSTQKVISKVNPSSRIMSSLKECRSLIGDSLRLINMSISTIGVVPDDKILKETKILGDLNEWISNATENLDRCNNGFEDDHELVFTGKFYFVRMKMKVFVTKNYVGNSLVILVKMDSIMHMFYHPVQSMLADFLLGGGGFDFGIVFYGIQYFLLIFLFCMLLRLY